MPSYTPCPQTSAFPCPVCHGATRAGSISRTMRLDGMPQFLTERMNRAKLWTCPTCAGRGLDHPSTYITWGDINMPTLVIAQYHQGRWNLEHTQADVRYSIEHNGQAQPAPAAAPATPAPAETNQPGSFTPSAHTLSGPGLRTNIGDRWFFRDVHGRVFEWMHNLQPIEMGHWEQIGSCSSETLAGLETFCHAYSQAHTPQGEFRCDCGAILNRAPPLNLYQRGLNPSRVQEVSRQTADYYFCNETAHHPDGERRGFLRFLDGTVLEYHGDNWIARRNLQAANAHSSVTPAPAPSPSPAGAGVDPQHVLQLLQAKLVRDHPGTSDHPEELLAQEVTTFLAGGRTTRTDAQIRFAIFILDAIGLEDQANSVREYFDDSSPSQ